MEWLDFSLIEKAPLCGFWTLLAPGSRHLRKLVVCWCQACCMLHIARWVVAHYPLPCTGNFANPIQLLTYNMVGQLLIWPCVLVVIVVMFFFETQLLIDRQFANHIQLPMWYFPNHCFGVFFMLHPHFDNLHFLLFINVPCFLNALNPKRSLIVSAVFLFSSFSTQGLPCNLPTIMVWCRRLLLSIRDREVMAPVRIGPGSFMNAENMIWMPLPMQQDFLILRDALVCAVLPVTT